MAGDPQPAPEEPAIALDTCQKLLANALVDAGIVGIDEGMEAPYLNRAFTQANWLLAQWARKRWLCYRIQDYKVATNGSRTYSVGKGQDVEINPRPDRLEYAYLRFLSNANQGGAFDLPLDPAAFVQAAGAGNSGNVDFPLQIIGAHEDYARIAVKGIGTFPQKIFYDPAWPIGVLRPWPVPQAGLYELHLGFKVTLPRFTSLNQPINLPPEYEAALNWSLVKRLRATYQMPADPAIDAMARDALNTIRLANTQIPVLRMPSALLNRGRAYDYRGDTN